MKYKSPEFEDEHNKQKLCTCDMPGCMDTAEHKAPKHRGLNEYYNFCFEHIREYNKAWDFFSGMSEREVQDHMVNSIYGDRPTWKYGVNGASPYDDLYYEAQKTYTYGNHSSEQQNNSKNSSQLGGGPEQEALALMGLDTPITFNDIKTRYKVLAKRYHPDLNSDNPDAEELLKKINMAYTILKMAYEDFQKLPDQNN